MDVNFFDDAYHERYYKTMPAYIPPEILIIIAQYLEMADNLIHASSALYRMPLIELLEDDVSTKSMAMDARCTADYPCIIAWGGPAMAREMARVHPSPEAIAEYFIDVHIYDADEELIIGLSMNKNWTDDDMRIAVGYLAAIYSGYRVKFPSHDDPVSDRILKYCRVARVFFYSWPEAPFIHEDDDDE